MKLKYIITLISSSYLDLFVRLERQNHTELYKDRKARAIQIICIVN